ncbi:porin [Thiomicrorhabdus immobilis]|uniref:Porin n=1 Tax=Thiomicrorhabdus immobilis TaxID=2791037 RepID=A0ABN6D1N2_9GAMM|nr:porin [Thiomicrorhabdus immobilis]BCN94035.1 porin [Thiomicrorhabdus immobilis]
MKKNIIAFAIASAVAAPVVMADAPVVYGIANMAVQANAFATKNLGSGPQSPGLAVNSVASRVGIKGTEDLGNGLKAIYQMEFNIDLSGNDSKQMNARNSFVGLAGGFGTVLMGTHDTPLNDTPLKMSQPKDLFNDGITDNGNVVKVLASGGEVRADNVIAYVSPSFAGIKLVAAGVSGTADGKGGAEDSELADAYSIAAMYGSTKKGLYLAAAYNGGDGFKDAEEMRLSAQYATGGLVANVMYETQENKGAAVVASAGYKMGNMMPKIKWADTSESKNSGKDGSVTALGLDYSLGKKTTAYIEYTMFDKDFTKGESVESTAVGLMHKF